MDSARLSDQSAAADRKRPLVPKEDDSDSKMQIMVLGSGQEVGRSCIMIKYQRKTVMLDCGTHPARSGESSLPFFDAWDLSEVDVALISHFHIDHAAAVPYLTERTAFKGKVYMTHPTKSIFKLVCDDIVNVNRSNSGAANEPLYTSQHVQNCLKRIEVCQYHQTIEEKGIKFTAYNAGHVLGAAMFMVEIDGVRVLYTGDYSRHEDRHLEMAELPRDSQNEIISPDILIVESTYGTQNNQSRQERESLFAKYVKDTVTNGGNALVPMFAIGRAQELMLILEEEWSRDERLKEIPIFYFGDMARKCLIAYDTYLSLMNEDIRKRHLEEGRSPFKFNFIRHVTKTSDPIFHNRPAGSPCVAIASPGMLQSGISLELFERWCSNEKNAVVLAGYACQNTTAHELQGNKQTHKKEDGREIPVKSKSHVVSFSAHADCQQTTEFIQELQPRNVILVHVFAGERTKMEDLKKKLEDEFTKPVMSNPPILPHTKFFAPANCELLPFVMPWEKRARVIGSLSKKISEGSVISGVVYEESGALTLVAHEELEQLGRLPTNTLQNVVLVPFHQKADGLKSTLRTVFDELLNGSNSNEVVVMKCVTVVYCRDGVVEVRWSSSVMNDAIADAVTCLLLHSNSCPAPLHHDIKSPAESVAAALGAAYVLDAADGNSIAVVLDGGHVYINKLSLIVEVGDDCPACFPRGAWSKDFPDENLSPAEKTFFDQISDVLLVNTFFPLCVTHFANISHSNFKIVERASRVSETLRLPESS